VDLDGIREVIIVFEVLNGMDAEALVAEDQVADAEDADFFTRVFMVVNG